MSDAASNLARSLTELQRQARHLMIDDASGVPIVRPGLIATLYFNMGHTEAVRQRLEACFVRFYQAFQPVLKWQFMHHPRRLSASGFAAGRRCMREHPLRQPLVWSLASASADQSATCSLSLTATGQAQARADLSCLKMVLPCSYLDSLATLKAYEDWLRYLCSAVQAWHGFAGLACVLPAHGQRYLSLEFQFARQYSGLMVDPNPEIESLRLLESIKGVSWYTVMGQSFVKRLGGSDALRARSSAWCDVQFHAYDGGLMVRAGSVPQLGGPGLPVPAAYAQVNQLIRPVRVQETGNLHACLVSGRGFDEVTTAQWYARFDARPVPPIRAGQPCPQSGYWFSSARAGSRRHFCQGEIMPAFDGIKAERTQWFCDRQQS